MTPVARIPKTALLEGDVTRIPHPPPPRHRRGVTRAALIPDITCRSGMQVVIIVANLATLAGLVINIAVWGGPGRLEEFRAR